MPSLKSAIRLLTLSKISLIYSSFCVDTFRDWRLPLDRGLHFGTSLHARKFFITVSQTELPIIFFNKFIYFIFIYFWLHWVFIAVCGLSLVVASGGYSSLWCAGFSLQWLLLLQSTSSRHIVFSSCGAQAQ